MTVTEIFNADELTTPTYQFTMLDEAGVAIPDLDLDTLRLTFYNHVGAAIINSRNDQDVKNLNEVAVVAGVVTWSMLTGDWPLVDGSLDHEIHIAEWEWTYSPAADTLTGRHLTRFRVQNFLKES